MYLETTTANTFALGPKKLCNFSKQVEFKNGYYGAAYLFYSFSDWFMPKQQTKQRCFISGRTEIFF